MSIHYKFKSAIDYDTITFDGLHISVSDLKKAIVHQKKLGKATDFDLMITNAQTNEVYTDESALIAKNTSLIVARVPVAGATNKKFWDRGEPSLIGTTSSSNSSSSKGAPPGTRNENEVTVAMANINADSAGSALDNLAQATDLSRSEASEEDKIKAMMTQSTQDYDPSKYMKIRGQGQVGPVPGNYCCFKCGMPGHWIKQCPLNLTMDIKKSTGIPRSFMVPVEGPEVPGAMMTPSGHFAVPAIDHEAYREIKKERPPFQAESPTPEVVKPVIPSELLCSLCKDLLSDAVLIPCCGDSFCDDCIRALLLDSEEQECPQCHTKAVSPDTLIPNRFLRTAVTNFRSETGYTKAAPVVAPAAVVEPVVVPEVKEDIEDEKEEPELILEDEEFKEEIATSPVAEEEFNEEPSEPPPPGGETLEEVRVPTPTVDEKPPATPTASAEGTQADVVKQSPTAPSKSTPPAVNNLSILAQKAPLIALQQALLQGNPLLLGSQNIQQIALIQQGLMAMQRIPHSSQSAPLLPTPSPIQTAPVSQTIPPQNSVPIQPLMTAQPPTHIPPPGFPRSMPPPRFQGPSIPPPGARPMMPPGGPRGLPPMGYPGAPPFPPNGMGMPPGYGNHASSAASQLASHPILQQGVIEDPLAAFEKLLKEKEERDRARKKRRSISRSRSRSRSRTRRSKSPRQRSRSRSGSPPRRRSRSHSPSRRRRSPAVRARRGRSRSRSQSGGRSPSPRSGRHGFYDRSPSHGSPGRYPREYREEFPNAASANYYPPYGYPPMGPQGLPMRGYGGPPGPMGPIGRGGPMGGYVPRGPHFGIGMPRGMGPRGPYPPGYMGPRGPMGIVGAPPSLLSLDLGRGRGYREERRTDYEREYYNPEADRTRRSPPPPPPGEFESDAPLIYTKPRRPDQPEKGPEKPRERIKERERERDHGHMKDGRERERERDRERGDRDKERERDRDRDRERERERERDRERDREREKGRSRHDVRDTKDTSRRTEAISRERDRDRAGSPSSVSSKSSTTTKEKSKEKEKERDREKEKKKEKKEKDEEDKKKDKKRKKKKEKEKEKDKEKDKEKEKKDKKKSKHDKKKSADSEDRVAEAVRTQNQLDQPSIPGDRSGVMDDSATTGVDRAKLEHANHRESDDFRIPTVPEEEAALEDVLIITTDKSLESLVDDIPPTEEDPDSSKTVKKDRSRERERDDKVKETKVLPLPHSRWEEDSEEDEGIDSVKNVTDVGAIGGDSGQVKRPDNAIFRRAISAIKPKVIEIKLRPERRVLLDSAPEKIGEIEMDDSGNARVSPDSLLNLRVAATAAAPAVVPKFNPALVDLKLLDVDEKKKSVRDRLGDKIEPEQPPARNHDKSDDTKDTKVDKSKEKKDGGKKDKEKRSSPAKDKKDRKEDKRDKDKRSRAKEKDKDKKHKRKEKEEKKSKEDKEKKDEMKSSNTDVRHGDKTKSSKNDDKQIDKDKEKSEKIKKRKRSWSSSTSSSSSSSTSDSESSSSESGGGGGGKRKKKNRKKRHVSSSSDSSDSSREPKKKKKKSKKTSSKRKQKKTSSQ